MNERIKELYDKLGLDFKNFQRVTVTEFDMQYFAELIVRECVHTVENRGGMCGALSSNWIKEHFGVKE